MLKNVGNAEITSFENADDSDLLFRAGGLCVGVTIVRWGRDEPLPVPWSRGGGLERETAGAPPEIPQAKKETRVLGRLQELD